MGLPIKNNKMNIFVLDLDPMTCAQYHCDKHVVKMILETAQMMSTTCRISGIDAGYKESFKNHPCTKWVRESIDNYTWLHKMVFFLNEEYKFRYDKRINHKSYDVIASLPLPSLPDIGLTPFAQAMPEDYKSSDAVESYRTYYLCEKRAFLSYSKREVPPWICL